MINLRAIALREEKGALQEDKGDRIFLEPKLL